ncbi:hypothetical protein [Streptomyces sp. 8N706]|uniref:hypothetical protein n=1 Tax=Streptomyces sp. 8N706 TaxID=3457416 RepID=UPI003FD46003
MCRLASDPSEPWIIRDTLYGRWTTLSRPRKVVIVGGALLALSALAGVMLLMESQAAPTDSDSRTEQTAETGIEAPKPSLILPTGGVVEPEPSPSRSPKSPKPKPKPKPKPTRTPSPSPKPKPTQKEPATQSGHLTYSAWAGHGCASPEDGGYEELGHWSDGIEGWFTVSPGGYEGGSCDGSFASVPMSGDRDRGNGAAVWWWSVGDDSDRCDVGVYIPRGDDHSVAGDPTTYMVFTDLDGRYADSTTFRIDQIAHRGELVDAGTFRVEGGRIIVKLLDSGQDWDEDGPTYAHHAAGQMKVTCRSD